jgi:hypothetical protein
MSAPRREMNPRRVAKSVRTHQATMLALGKAAMSNIGELSHSQNHPNIDPSDPHRVLSPRMTNSKQLYSGINLWRVPQSVNLVGSAHQKIDSQYRKGLITQAEATTEKSTAGFPNGAALHDIKPVERKSKKETLRAHVPTEDF